MSLHFESLSPIGIQVVDPDIDYLLESPDAPDEIMDALDANSVLLIRGLELDDATQLRFARRLGEVIARIEQGNGGWSREYPGIYRVALDPEANNEFYVKGAWDWHFDGSTAPGSPPRATMLSCRKPAGTGGDTQFVSTYSAYDLLTDDEKARFEHVKVWHRVDPSLYTHKIEMPDAMREKIMSEPAQLHPLVWTHRSGRKSLVIGFTAHRVDGMPEDEGRALLDDLLERATRPEHVLTHQWQLHDFVMWDNRGTMHRGRPFEAKTGRDMHRCTLVGDEPIQ